MREFEIPVFEDFESIPRLFRDMVVTEKIDAESLSLSTGDSDTSDASSVRAAQTSPTSSGKSMRRLR